MKPKMRSACLPAFSILLSVIAGCTKSPTESRREQSLAQQRLAESKRAPEIVSVREVGVIKKPRAVLVRDGGAAAIIGGKLLWFFGDTIFNPASVDGTNLRTNTAALADPTKPLEANEPVDANGAPYQFVPFTPAEKAYNDSTGRPDDRIALWPGSVIADGQGNGQAFYLKLKVQPGSLNYEFAGIGLAQIEKTKLSRFASRSSCLPHRSRSSTLPR